MKVKNVNDDIVEKIKLLTNAIEIIRDHLSDAGAEYLNSLDETIEELNK